MLIAFHVAAAAAGFTWPEPSPGPPSTVGGRAVRADGRPGLAGSGWVGGRGAGRGAHRDWREQVARRPRPGPDSGQSPTQAKRSWAKLGVNGFGLADFPPGPGGLDARATFTGAQRRKLRSGAPTAAPMLTVSMAAALQGFPPSWQFVGGKTAAYRQVGNAFPPPVARVLGEAIRDALEAAS
jgi:DNA (cytosine-5)-methyltransferase 1